MHERSLAPVHGEPFTELKNPPLDGSDHIVVTYVIKDVAHPTRQRSTLLLSEATSGNCRRAYPKTTRDKGRSRIIGHSIFIDRDVGAPKRGVRRFSSNTFIYKIE
jgi:hypothetical protein